MKIVIIKYNAGNVYSVRSALQRLGVEPFVSDDPGTIQNADKVIFPGVGEASTAKNYLDSKGLSDVLIELKQPVLGICLGLQLFCKQSEENNTIGLNIFDTEVKKFPETEKVPHMGWNALQDLKGPLFTDIADRSYVYFVHSYYAELSKNTIAKTIYSVPFSAALQKDNFYALQFHPEKSAKVGEQILKNFMEL
ncbi:MAG: imidazole glycerol phosphate synthase subunit HisH [Calditrichaeota bacterium]|nr:MAG: imidazole glycerol phosphate synthase subunit HisH [Calditrichota bacterium]MBL1205617.1 imidazole glycerol phosphate synthase subunit HisH [Calditrichota bacterium]NOG45445.1 imidazole glycerol phosphate synthase subunit HisH [Calditrichota bacterium]